MTKPAAKPECPYCGATEGLRIKCDGGGVGAPEYTCEGCFTGVDDGPCFDDLPKVTGILVVTDKIVKHATQEFLSHRGERPERIMRGGYALWEENAPAMRAALEVVARLQQ